MSRSWEALVSWMGLVLWRVKPRTPRLVGFVWALVLAKPLVSLLIGSPIVLVGFSIAETQPKVAQVQGVPITSGGTPERVNALDHLGALQESPSAVVLGWALWSSRLPHDHVVHTEIAVD
jgi:hypothetical protein